MNHLCENYEYHGWEPIITVLLGTGMRIGECLGLCWDDLDFQKEIIKVRKTLIYRSEPGNGCVVHISTPKTEAGSVCDFEWEDYDKVNKGLHLYATNRENYF